MRAIALVLLLALAGPAAAHSELRASVPATGARLAAAPDGAVLTFNEAVQVTAFRLFRASGEEVALTRAGAIATAPEFRIALPALAPGAYRIEWRIISADGHPVGGTIRFTVGAGP